MKPRIEDSVKLIEGSNDPKSKRATWDASTHQDLGYKMITF
jgi:hypothetical protein